MTTEDFVSEIMEFFIKSNSRPDHVLFVRDIFNQFSISEGSEKYSNFIEAIQKLKSQGYISIEKRAAGLECLVLTTKGFESIKKSEKDFMSIEDFVNEIMELFIKSNSRPDHVLFVRDIFNKFSISEGSEKYSNFIEAVQNLNHRGIFLLRKELLV